MLSYWTWMAGFLCIHCGASGSCADQKHHRIGILMKLTEKPEQTLRMIPMQTVHNYPDRIDYKSSRYISMTPIQRTAAAYLWNRILCIASPRSRFLLWRVRQWCGHHLLYRWRLMQMQLQTSAAHCMPEYIYECACSVNPKATWPFSLIPPPPPRFKKFRYLPLLQ